MRAQTITGRVAAFFVGGAAMGCMLHNAVAQDVMVLEEISVEAESDDTLVQDGYVAKQDRLGTKVDTPIAQIPQAISVVTQDQIEDQKPRTLNEALNYTASANPNGFGFDSRYDAFYLRGFPAYYNGMFRDGLRQYNGPSAWFKPEPYGIEGVTILKGPASSLYGISGPGGIVNLVTKRPKEEQFREVEVLVGNHDRYQAAFDLSGPANEAGTVLYRMTGLGRLANTELPGYPDDKLYLAPAITLKPDEDTKLTILGEYSHSVTGGTASFYTSSYGVASDIYEGDPAYNDFTNNQGRIGYEFEHRFNDTVTVRQNLRYNVVDADLEYSYHYPVGNDLQRGYGHYIEDMANFVVDNMAQFNFATGPLEHEAVVGIDYAWTDYSADSATFYPTVDDARAGNPPFAGSQTANQVGIYLHDQIDINNLTLFASGRYDWVGTESVDASFAETEQTDEAFSYRLGASYRTEWGLIPYANYSTSFSPNIGLVYDDLSIPDPVGRIARPTIARQMEAGVKYEIPDTNVILSAAVFDIDQEDGVVFDTSTGVNRQRQLDMNSRGFELEANASFDNGFSLIASYTHLRVKIEKGAMIDLGEGPESTEGKELSATPNNILSLWGHYVFQDGPLVGLGLGAGVRYVGESYGDDLNTFKNDDRAFVDAAISYDFGARNPDLKGLSMQVNAKNLFDTRKQTCSAGYCYRDEGVSVFGSLRYRF
ncbi:iron complex outermembrane receptor protein [Mesorhizobium sp. J18]|uniref:TonB-dependent siderophore receptor n=1 Tax=Mesorhizobium sp. J18 TaxID=935263 RepID=UPI00119BB9C0|nr:TonB-dependent siderophore receptor [Mesorhizobium sp. J18]TWG95400.1 iron complex outermembrane receptor protein [Mesorhizobium sp. J18]